MGEKSLILGINVTAEAVVRLQCAFTWTLKKMGKLLDTFEQEKKIIKLSSRGNLVRLTDNRNFNK